MKGSNQQENWVKCHRMKYHRVWTTEMSIIKGVTIPILKVDNPMSLKGFHPVIIFNVLVKVIS